MKNVAINVTNLPADVQTIYLHRQQKKRVIKSDIKKFKNEATVKPGDASGMQLDLNFICWPIGTVNFLIHKDGTIFHNLKERYKQQRELFWKSLMSISNWTAQDFVTLYQNIVDQGAQYCVWVLPFLCQQKECSAARGFICADPFVDNDSDLPL